MRVGVPTEVKTDEYRVALTPAGVRELVDAGHEVFVQSGAGVGSAITDDAYAAQGAAIVPDADAVFAGGELIVKVKEPQPEEVERLEPRHMLFTYLHLAADADADPGARWSQGRPASPTRPSRTHAAGCPCSPRCPRLRARSPPRPGRSCSRSRSAAAASCSVAFPAWPPRT